LDTLLIEDEYKLSKRYSCKKGNCNLAVPREEFSVEMGTY